MHAKLLLKQSARWRVLYFIALLASLSIFGVYALDTYEPTVVSDKDDYAPGEIAIISGYGWTQDSLVDVHLEEDPAHDHHHEYHDTKVNPDGSWQIEYPIEDRHLGVKFTVLVEGKQSGARATTTFTDGNFKFDAAGLPNGQEISIDYGWLQGQNPINRIKTFTTPNQSTTDGVNNNDVSFRYNFDNVTLSGIKYKILNYTNASNTGTVTTINTLFNSGGGSANRTITANYGALVVENVSGVYGEKVNLVATLYSNYQTGSKISGKQIIFRAGSSPVVFSNTDSNGQATVELDLTLLQIGDHPIVADFNGDASYLSINGSANLSIGKGNATISLSNLSHTYDGTAKSATVTTNPAELSGVTVTYNGSETAPTAAGTYEVVATLNNANYEEQQVTGKLVINKAAADVELAELVHTYNGQAKSASATTNAPGTSSFTFTYDGSTELPVNYKAGGYAVVATLVNNNYAGSATGTLTINKANQNLTWNNPEPITYGTALSAYQLNAVNTTGNGSLTYQPALGTVLNADSYTLQVTAAETENYNQATASVSLTVNKANATINIQDYQGVYDGTSHTASGTANGVLGESLSHLLSFGDGYINAPGGETTWAFAGNNNYNAASGNVLINIAKIDAAIQIEGYEGTFDGEEHGASGIATGLGGIDLKHLLNLGESYTDAGNHTANWTFGGNENYKPTSGAVTIKIAKATPVIALTTGDNPTYDGNTHYVQSATVSGINGSYLGEAVVTYTRNGSPISSPVGAGAYDVTATFAETVNYKAAETKYGWLTIKKADATIIVESYTGTYDGKQHGAAGSAIGVNDEVLAGLDLGARYTDAPGGTANWSFTDVTGNYNNNSGTVQINIGKANASLSVTGFTGVYNASSHGATGTATGVVGEDLSDLLNLGASFTDVPGGTANWSFAGNGNYNAASGTASIIIEKATPAITLNIGEERTYNGQPHYIISALVTGVNNADLGSANVTYSLAGEPVVNPTNAGSYDVLASYTGSNNYTEAETKYGTLIINKAAAVVNISGYTGIYDGEEHGASGSAIGVSGEVLNGLDLGAKFTDAPGGTANWQFIGGNNYNNQSGTASIVISKADATITVTGFTGTYDGQARGANGTAVGVKNEDLSSLLTLGNTYTDVPGGAANWSFAGNTNYNSASGSVNIVINKALATLTLGNLQHTYDGTTKSATAVTSPVGLTGVSISNNGKINAGTYAVTATLDNNNYEAQDVTENLVINKANQTITWATPAAITYGEALTTAQLNATVAGVANGSAPGALTYLPEARIYLNAGDHTLIVKAAETENYSEATASVSLIVNKANATIAVSGYAGVYDGNAHGASGTATGGRNENLNSLLDFGSQFTNATGGTATWRFAGDANHNEATGSVAIIINPRAITVTPNAAQSKVYGDADPESFTFTPSEGLIGGNSFIGKLGRISGATVGEYAYTIGDLAAAPNYAVSLAVTSNKFAITPKGITGSFTAANKMHDNSNVATIVQRTLTGVLPADEGNMTLTGGSASFADANPGEDKVVTATGMYLAGSAKDNYALLSVNPTRATIYAIPTVTINNPGPTEVGKQLIISANYTGIVNQPIWVWSFNTIGTAGAMQSYQCTGAVTVPSQPGVYTVYLEYKDALGNPLQTAVAYVPVYDPNGGFVTGGGWIESPAGAVRTSNYGLAGEGAAGKANFGFVAKYKKGSQSVVEGNTEFQFNAGKLNFKSTLHDEMSLIVTSDKATYKGVGSLNGYAGFKFSVIAIDGEVKGQANSDKFRIKIWDANNALVYDNYLSGGEYDEPTTTIGGGSIVIHENKSVGKTTTSSKLLTEAKPALEQQGSFFNYPNAFSDRTTIAFSLSKEESYSLEVYDVKGALVKKVSMGVAEADKVYEFEVDGRNMAEGIYIARLVTSSNSQSIKMILKK